MIVHSRDAVGVTPRSGATTQPGVAERTPGDARNGTGTPAAFNNDAKWSCGATGGGDSAGASCSTPLGLAARWSPGLEVRYRDPKLGCGTPLA
ncbi:hypothetical protein CKO51_10360 [Rhodopirellula sp. SM50]|nr:hypothetical protein CKO51_10360 [Rhodopirellula sp. SM50]